MHPERQRQFPLRRVGTQFQRERLRHADEFTIQFHPGKAVALIRTTGEVISERGDAVAPVHRFARHRGRDFAAAADRPCAVRRNRHVRDFRSRRERQRSGGGQYDEPSFHGNPFLQLLRVGSSVILYFEYPESEEP
ncbi:hypothetical protein SDC9_179964 [bioreactor metagenome]|uniref:Uncharacterized protein n=1 Tax=bioreactor metagenome TaxID=1076179 RepID=A0A645H0B6_9ZZZZ